SKKHEALLEQKEIIALKERQLEDYQRATAHFSDKLKLLTELELEYKHSQEQLSGLREKQKSLADRQQTQSKLVEAAKSAYLKRDEIRQTCDDLEHIIQVQRSEKERVEIADELKAYAARLTEMELQMKQITEQLVEHEEIIQKEKEQMDDIAQLKDLASIFQQLDQLTQQRMKLEGAHQVRHDRQLAIASRINKLSERFAAKYQMVLEGDELPEMNPEVLEKQVEQIDEQLLDLQQRNVFAKHASQLEDGEPCPLCGSEHHPHLAHTPAILSEMEDLKAQKQRLKEQLKDLATLQLEVGKLGTELEQLGLQHHQYEETLVALAKQQQNLEQQKSAFEAHDLSAKAVSNRIAHYQERQQQLKKLEAKFIQLKDTLEACRKKVEVNKVEEHQRQNRLTKANAAVETHLASLKTLQYEKFKAYSIEDLEANHQKGQQKLMKLEAHYLKSQALQAELEKEIHTIDGQIQSLTTQFQSLKRKLQAIQQLIQDTLLETGFTKLEVVRDLLKLELNVSKEQDFIRQFYEELMKLEIRLKELSVRLDSNPFDHQALTDTRNRVKALELKQKEYVEQIAQTTQYLAINQKKLAEKRAYQASLKQFAIRQTNLKVFTDKLFKAKGFVEYVSTVYLQNLVWAANERFVKLTKNKMSLELDEGNDFIIRDFLNGGKTRALKTLSGGQTFQIALCLALALAENVKSLNQAEQSFFFLDEGFGTLDRSSLRIVFETLKSLQQENRIVGVISHVEELKQEIDVALLIENNSEKGSIISRSWI
ncbi:MAG: SbcC/MukB-like Walker B domain-containing protein, partial [Flammeovirgaceae bacterium]